MGQSLIIQIWPSRSIICALISPTFSCIKSRQSFLPWMMDSRASLTQSGHSESVCRGQPRVGFVFSQDFKSGLSDHFGVKDGFGLYLLKNCTMSKVASAALQTAQSRVLSNCVPTRFGINLYPLFRRLPRTRPGDLEPTQSLELRPKRLPPGSGCVLAKRYYERPISLWTPIACLLSGEEASRLRRTVGIGG